MERAKSLHAMFEIKMIETVIRATTIRITYVNYCPCYSVPKTT